MHKFYDEDNMDLYEAQKNRIRKDVDNLIYSLLCKGYSLKVVKEVLYEFGGKSNV